MRLSWGAWLWLVFVLPSSSVSVYPDCPNLSEDRISALKLLKVTEDVHDELVGDYGEVWGPREVIDPDQNTCIKFHRQRSDEKTLIQTMTADGEWFGGKRLINLTLERVENGVYLARKENVVKSVFFILFARNNVVTHYAWEACSRDLNEPPCDSKKRYINFVTGVSVRSRELMTSLHPDTQVVVDEAVRVIQAHKDLLGDIVPLAHRSC